jgi:DNA-binding SARP family transcriptional activator
VLEVLVLGTTLVLADGVGRPISSVKQRLIVAHLALADGAPVSEDVLIEELWDVALADPLHALHAHVSRLRRATSLPIVHGGGGYRLDEERVRVDAARFELLLRQGGTGAGSPDEAVGTLEAALALWRGPALADLPDTQSVHAHRVRLDLLRHQAVTALVEAHLAAGRPDHALPLLHASVEADPLDERRWGQLMVALARSGQRGEALATYARARGHLVDDLGLEPSSYLQRIQQEILAAAPEMTDAPGASGPLGGPDGVDPAVPQHVVGRCSEWDTLVRLWREAGADQRVAVISGEPGIGKTFLASQFVGALGSVPTYFGRSQVTRVAPYEVLAQLIRSECARSGHSLLERLGPGARALHALVPDLVPEDTAVEPGTRLDPQVERHRILLGLEHWLRVAAAARPLCLVIDDLQWADPDSLQLLAELWSRPHTLRVLWLVTVRDDEHPPGASLAALVNRAIHPSASTTVVPLAGLSRAAVADLMQRQDGAETPPPARTLDEVLATTAGNPLLVTETVRHLSDGGGVGDMVSFAVPQSLKVIIEGYLGRLDRSDRGLLDLAAIVGEEFDAVLVRLAGDHTPEQVDGFLASAQRLGLLEPVADQGLRQRFRHSLVHTVVVQQIAPLRRARLHLRVADAVETSAHVVDRLHVLAHHRLRAVSLTGPDRAIPYVLAAAESSLRHGAPAVAWDLYRQAQEQLGPEAPREQRTEIHLGLGESGFRAGTDYRDDLLVAARLASEAGDVDRLVRAAVANHRGWYSSIAEVDRDRVSVIEAALSMLPDADDSYGPARSRLLSLWAMENVRDPSRREEALSRSEESMRIAEELGAPALLGEIMCHRFSVLYATFADPVGTVAFARHLDAFAHARIDPELQLNSAIAVAQSSMMVGDFATADAALDRSQRLAHELAHPPRMWLVGTWVATRTAMRGDLERAQAEATAAYEMGAAFEQPDAETWFVGQLFAFHHAMGRLPELVDVIEEQVNTLTDQIPAWRTGYALALASVDRWAEAREIVDEFRSTGFEALPRDVLHLHGLCHLAETAVTTQHVEAAPELYDALLPHEGLIANNATIDSGPVDLRLAGLAALMGDHASADRHLRSAEAFCLASGAAVWLEHVVKARALLA